MAFRGLSEDSSTLIQIIAARCPDNEISSCNSCTSQLLLDSAMQLSRAIWYIRTIRMGGGGIRVLLPRSLEL